MTLGGAWENVGRECNHNQEKDLKVSHVLNFVSQ